jgi:hypothetical protein
MTMLNGYNAFGGRHWETGSVHNFYAYRGINAPHSGQPYSEALLLGVSGGIVMGYFSFAYKGYDPHVALLTRNTFDPLETLLGRLGVEQEILQTSLPEKGLRNLVQTLESGLPAITWVDIFSLPYLDLPNDDDMYLMYPVVVYGFDAANERVWIADRAKVPLTATPAQLASARARVKKDKFRVMTLGAPNPDKLVSAVQKGIGDTLGLFTEKPPKGSRENFGFAAYERWQALLLQPKHKNSWAAVFPPGRGMVAGLTSAFFGTIQNGPGCDGERGMYADFLEEAALILNRPRLNETAGLFRAAGAEWEALGRTLLPDEAAPLGELRALMLRRKALFREQGAGAAAEILAINARIHQLKQQAAADFPLTGSDLSRFLDALSAQIRLVQTAEQTAVQSLQAVMMQL